MLISNSKVVDASLQLARVTRRGRAQAMPPKWHQWSLRSLFVLTTLVSVDIRCSSTINHSFATIYETVYLVTIGWDEFAVLVF